MECEGGKNCTAGHKVWSSFCDNSIAQKFVWIPNLNPTYVGIDANFGQLKMAYFDLCLERMTTYTYLLQQCDIESPFQVLVGWHPTKAFELHPVENPRLCINQHHHPRPEEEVAMTSCDTAVEFKTDLWNAYKNDNAQNEMVRLRRPQCSANNQCGECEGGKSPVFCLDSCIYLQCKMDICLTLCIITPHHFF